MLESTEMRILRKISANILRGRIRSEEIRATSEMKKIQSRKRDWNIRISRLDLYLLAILYYLGFLFHGISVTIKQQKMLYLYINKNNVCFCNHLQDTTLNRSKYFKKRNMVLLQSTAIKKACHCNIFKRKLNHKSRMTDDRVVKIARDKSSSEFGPTPDKMER